MKRGLSILSNHVRSKKNSDDNPNETVNAVNPKKKGIPQHTKWHKQLIIRKYEEKYLSIFKKKEIKL
jgi:hypothetical protein